MIKVKSDGANFLIDFNAIDKRLILLVGKENTDFSFTGEKREMGKISTDELVRFYYQLGCVFAKLGLLNGK